MRHRYAFASRRTSVRQNASRRVKTTASADTNLKPQIQHTWHLLPDGTKLEVLTQTSHHVSYPDLLISRCNSEVYAMPYKLCYSGTAFCESTSIDAAWFWSRSMVLSGIPW